MATSLEIERELARYKIMLAAAQRREKHLYELVWMFRVAFHPQSTEGFPVITSQEVREAFFNYFEMHKPLDISMGPPEQFTGPQGAD